MTCDLARFNPIDPEDCTACSASPGPCPYHQGVIDGHDSVVNDVRPWVRWDREKFGGFPEGTRLRVEFRAGVTDSSEHYVHPDDVPDPDADLIERMAFALYQHAGGDDYPRMSSASDREHYIPAARAALAVIREEGAR